MCSSDPDPGCSPAGEAVEGRGPSRATTQRWIGWKIRSFLSFLLDGKASARNAHLNEPTNRPQSPAYSMGIIGVLEGMCIIITNSAQAGRSNPFRNIYSTKGI